MSERFERFVLLVRGIVYRGGHHRCPVCGWRLRAFCGPRSFRRRESNYCPRCNSKSRHRYLVHMEGRIPLTATGRTLYVAPNSCLRRRLGHAAGWFDLDRRPESSPAVVGDVERMPFADAAFELVVCLHVLEHVDHDVVAMAELARVVGPGGRALVGIPFDGRPQTDEDPSVTSAVERKRRFGEADHRRAYGEDIVDRLTSVGFEATLRSSSSLDPVVADDLGIRPDEAIVECRKPHVVEV